MDIKKLTILNIVLAIAVVVLFVMHFACGSCGNPSQKGKADGKDTAKFTNSDGYKIAWANSDTVTKYYKLATKLTNSLTEQQIAAETSLKTLYDKYQTKQAALQKEAPILGQTELQLKMQDLQKLEQQIMAEEQKLQNELMEKEYAATDSFISLTNEFMQEIGSELGYDYVISFKAGGQVMYAHPGLDITDEIIEKLNETYAKHGQTK